MVNGTGVYCAMYPFQDTCVGFLLGGIGEMNKSRQPNFMVVDKSMHTLFWNSVIVEVN